jgi:hypothetical protein
MDFIPLFEIDPDLAASETYGFRSNGDPVLPDGEYGIAEAYCSDPTCDCRLVMLHVVFRDPARTVATPLAAISFGFDRDAEYSEPMLDVMNRQSKYAVTLLGIIERILAQPEYPALLERHYRVFKQSVGKRPLGRIDRSLTARAAAVRESPTGATEARRPPARATRTGSAEKAGAGKSGTEQGLCVLRVNAES